MDLTTAQQILSKYRSERSLEVAYVAKLKKNIEQLESDYDSAVSDMNSAYEKYSASQSYADYNTYATIYERIRNILDQRTELKDSVQREAKYIAVYRRKIDEYEILVAKLQRSQSAA